jgi:hypothetical protein
LHTDLRRARPELLAAPLKLCKRLSRKQYCQLAKKHEEHGTYAKKYDESKDGVSISSEHEFGSVVAIYASLKLRNMTSSTYSKRLTKSFEALEVEQVFPFL